MPRSMYLGLLLALPLAASTVRIIQTNSAGDDVSIIDPATNKVVGTITGIEVNLSLIHISSCDRPA